MKLAITSREVQGKKVKSLRKNGMVPGVVYGRQLEQPVAIQIDKVKLVKAYQKTWMSTPLELHGDGLDYLVLFQDLQLDPVSDHVLHVDFLAVKKDEVVSADVPVIITGVSPFEKAGKGKVQLVTNEVTVEAFPMDLPREFTLDISWIESINDVIHISDLKVSDKVKILDDPETTLVTVVEFTAEAEETTTTEAPAAGAAPTAPEAGETKTE